MLRKYWHNHVSDFHFNLLGAPVIQYTDQFRFAFQSSIHSFLIPKMNEWIDQKERESETNRLVPQNHFLELGEFVCQFSLYICVKWLHIRAWCLIQSQVK